MQGDHSSDTQNSLINPVDINMTVVYCPLQLFRAVFVTFQLGGQNFGRAQVKGRQYKSSRASLGATDV